MFLFCSWCVCFGTLQTLAVCFKKPPSTVFFLTSWCIHTIYVCTYIPVSKIYLLYVHMKSFIILTLFDMEWWDPNSLLLASYWQWAVGSSGLPNSSSISAWIRESFGLCWTLAHRDPKWSEVHQDQNSTCQVFPMNICFFCRFAGSCHARFFLPMGSQQADCTQTRPLEMFSERQVGVNQRNSNSNSPGGSFCWCHLDVILMWVPLVIIHFSGIFYETIQRFFGVPPWHWKAPFFCAESMMTPHDPNHGAGIFILYQHLPLSKITKFW